MIPTYYLLELGSRWQWGWREREWNARTMQNLLLPLKLASLPNEVLEVNSVRFYGPFQVCVHVHL